MIGVPPTLLIFILQTLKEEWKDHKNLKEGEKLELTLLQNGLGKLEASLRHAEKITEKSYLLKQKESEIRELLYDVEDIIEISLTKTAASKTKSLFSRLWGNVSTELEKEIRELREKRVQPILTQIDETFGKPEINNGSTSSLAKPLPEIEIKESNGEPSSQEDQKNIKLKDKKIVEFPDEATILGHVLESNEKLDVIAITGMAGIGKTTFAQKIYEHENVVARFPWRIWVPVSEKFNSTDAFRKILKELTFKKTFVKAEELIGSVRRVLEIRKGFLLVMDDVWRIEDWEVIRQILPENNAGKVLVTTREIRVAEVSSNVRLPHHLKILDKNKSFELLKFQVFDKLDQFDEELKMVGRDIAEKCGGVPLMILVIGRILKELYTDESRGIPAIRKKWLEVLKNMDKYIREDEKDLISNAVELSYMRLSHDLKLCFLYTGLFPGDDEIPVSTLTQLWIAEGFVPWNEGQSAEENADKILKTLIKMNLVMVAKKNLEHVITCRVHDMVRVFCRTIAKKENLFRVIERSNEDPLPLTATVGFRRLSFNVDPSGFLSNNMRCVRSFLWFDSDTTPKPTVPTVSSLLRVLNCRSIRFQQFPEVKTLLLLKHITLFIQNLKYLPETISKLVNLQTLIVDTNSGSITVEANIWTMVRLRRLKTKAAILLSRKNWKGKYRGNLQTISRMPPDSCNAVLSQRAPYLKTLGVRGKLADVEKTMVLNGFEKLEKLKLVNDLDDEANPSNPMVFTRLDWFPPNLKSLTLLNTHLKWRMHMSILAKIKSLEVLKLKNNAFVGMNWDANEGWDTIDGAGFPNLEFLLMDKLRLAFWKAPDTHFPNLRLLVIKSCELLDEIPENLPKHLESLEIEHVKSSLVASAKIIAQKQIILNQKRSCEVAFKLTIDQVPFSVTINANSAASSSGQDN